MKNTLQNNIAGQLLNGVATGYWQLLKTFFFDRCWKVLTNQIESWKFSNSMWKDLENSWISVAKYQCDSNVKIFFPYCQKLLTWCSKISLEWVWKRYLKNLEKFLIIFAQNCQRCLQSNWTEMPLIYTTDYLIMSSWATVTCWEWVRLPRVPQPGQRIVDSREEPNLATRSPTDSVCLSSVSPLQRLELHSNDRQQLAWSLDLQLWHHIYTVSQKNRTPATFCNNSNSPGSIAIDFDKNNR